jgi:hypothetical protein
MDVISNSKKAFKQFQHGMQVFNGLFIKLF